MKKLFFVFIAFGTVACAQEVVDAKAKKILDEMSAKTKTYKTTNTEFAYTLENKAKKTTETNSGKLMVKGQKYKLEVANQIIICDSKVIWTILKDASEIQVNNTSAQKDENITPTTIFTIYEKGFKYQYIKEEKQKSGVMAHIIKMFPLDTKKNYHTVLLTIDKVKKQLISIKVLGKDGNDVTYAIKKLVVDADIPDATFTCNTKSYPKYEVIDLRE